MRLLPLYLLIFGIPLGVAGQNLVSAIVFLILVKRFLQDGAADFFIRLSHFHMGFPFFTMLAYVLWMLIATQLAPINENADATGYFSGFLPMIFFPVLLGFGYGPLTDTELRRCIRGLVAVGIFWGIVCLSQYLWHWKLGNGGITITETGRARGLYSHPLSLAYAALLMWPAAIVLFIKAPRQIAFALLFLGIGIALWTSESRTAQIVAFGVLLFNVFYLLQRKARLIGLSSLVLAGVLVATIDNPVRRKFEDTVSGNEDRHSNYVDDRVAFWHAHWELFKERPVLGHGIHMTTKMREGAYTKIGLADFDKKYEAHNTYLQVLVEGGVVGLIIFIAWIGWYLRWSWRHVRESTACLIILQTWIAFLVAALTQNAFHDSEVRYALMLLCIATWLYQPLTLAPKTAYAAEN